MFLPHTGIALTFGLAILLPVFGCAAPSGSDETVRTQSSAVVTANGETLNGRSLNGRSLNGRSLNGMELNGRSLNGRSLNGRTLDGVSVEGMRIDNDELHDVVLDGTWLEGRGQSDDKYKRRDFVGATMNGILDDGSVLPIRIDAIEQRVDARSSDVHRYTLSFHSDEGWNSYCGTNADGSPVRAIPLEGRWDYREGVPGGGSKISDPAFITFACEGFTLAKCVELGYRPWDRVRSCARHIGCSWVSLAGHHQACTRILRADYCGDGSSNTIDGTLINLYDAYGIQRDTENWSFEAEWTPEGARCVSRGRVAALPACAVPLETSDCGDRLHFATGTLLMDEDTPTQTASVSD